MIRLNSHFICMIKVLFLDVVHYSNNNAKDAHNQLHFTLPEAQFKLSSFRLLRHFIAFEFCGGAVVFQLNCKSIEAGFGSRAF